MLKKNPYPEDHPGYYVHNIRNRFNELIAQLRADIHRVDDPQAKALFETTAEALGGLAKAFEDYEKQNEAAWQ